MGISDSEKVKEEKNSRIQEFLFRIWFDYYMDMGKKWFVE